MSEFRRKLLGKQENMPCDLIFYAPLNYEDFTDHVSGANLNNAVNNPRIYWDPIKGMYKIYKRSYGQNNLYWDVDLRKYMKLEAGQQWTLIADFQTTGQSPYNVPNVINLGQYNFTNPYKPCLCVWDRETNKTKLKRRALIYSGGGTIKRIADQAINYTTTEGPSALVRPNNWTDANECYSKICLQDHRSGEPSIDCWIKNIRMYNRELSIEEIYNL